MTLLNMFDKNIPVMPESIINILGVVYIHVKTSDGGEMYLTRFGFQYRDLLDINNWYEKEWFESHRERLKGTSSVYRIHTKEIDGKSLELVVKNSRVGEDVPLATHTLIEFINAEFNSPWEEFSLVMEMGESRYGPDPIRIKTQAPLAIYVPPEKMQVWQSGRSVFKMNRIHARHPGIDLDILRQYKLIYGWIKGKNVFEVFDEMGTDSDEMIRELVPITKKVTDDLDIKGYIMADMKPEHVIIGEEHTKKVEKLGKKMKSDTRARQTDYIHTLIRRGKYSVVDYELLLRTPQHEQVIKDSRRHSYLDDQRDRFIAAPLPSHLMAMDILGVPYVHGHAESTNGHVWVVGRNPRLFDYFLPERWRKTPCLKLSENNEIYYTLTKDNIHVVWKTSRVGEMPAMKDRGDRAAKVLNYGYNSPFEEYAIALYLNSHGVPSVYVRAIYMAGSTKIEQSSDMRRYESHSSIVGPDGEPILRYDHNYITIRGYYNGPDSWVAERHGWLYKPVDLVKALDSGIISKDEYDRIIDTVRRKLKNIGYDGSLLQGNDMLLVLTPDGEIVKDAEGFPEARICNFELIHLL
ncbi:hypothetical protein LLG96_11260 [bacterium]|nr:hypothetical protein [bacterium]